MKILGFLLFRLNFVDREELFQRPIANDSALTQVIEAAGTDEFDVVKQGSRSGYKWALREVTSGLVDELGRPFIFVMLSREVMSRRGPIVMPDRITHGTSTVSPPSATLVRILIDLKRHICAVEEVPSIVQARSGWKSHLQGILNSAAWKLGYTSMVDLDPIIPTEIVSGRLQSLDKVTRLRVTLRIPNPDLGPSYQRLYDEMKRGGVRELSQDMRNEQGLTIEPETLPQSTLEMAMKGYRKGKIHVYGYTAGQRDDFTVTDDVARVEIEELRSFVEGYGAASRSSVVKQFAELIIKKIDDDVSR